MPSWGDETGHRTFFLPPPWPDGEEVATLDRDESNHALRSLRVRCGDRVRLVDGQGRVAAAEVIDAAPKGSGRGSRTDFLTVRVGPVSTAPADRAQAGRVSIPWIRTPSRMDWILEKATELGAVAFDIYFADNSAKTAARQIEQKTERWERITRAAMKQSDRAWWPRVTVFESLASVLAAYEAATVVTADPGGDTEVTAATRGNLEKTTPADRLLIIGAEGGWSETEQRLLCARSPVALSLGPARLRVETAAVVLCAKICLEVPEA